MVSHFLQPHHELNKSTSHLHFDSIFLANLHLKYSLKFNIRNNFCKISIFLFTCFNVKRNIVQLGFHKNSIGLNHVIIMITCMSLQIPNSKFKRGVFLLSNPKYHLKHYQCLSLNSGHLLFLPLNPCLLCKLTGMFL